MDRRYTTALPNGAKVLCICCKDFCHMGYYPEFSQLLNQFLQRQERSASWLADRLGVSPSTVGRWLNDGLRPGKPETIVQIAEIFGAAEDAHAFLVAAGYARVSPVHANISDMVSAT